MYWQLLLVQMFRLKEMQWYWKDIEPCMSHNFTEVFNQQASMIGASMLIQLYITVQPPEIKETLDL